jgi:hypothetical protein
MARGAATFRQRDARAAVKAVVSAGCEVDRVAVDKAGKIVVIVRRPQDAAEDRATAATEANEWDRV